MSWPALRRAVAGRGRSGCASGERSPRSRPPARPPLPHCGSPRRSWLRLRMMPGSFSSRSTSAGPNAATRPGSKPAKARRKFSRLRSMVNQLSPDWNASRAHPLVQTHDGTDRPPPLVVVIGDVLRCGQRPRAAAPAVRPGRASPTISPSGDRRQLRQAVPEPGAHHRQGQPGQGLGDRGPGQVEQLDAGDQRPPGAFRLSRKTPGPVKYGPRCSISNSAAAGRSEDRWGPAGDHEPVQQTDRQRARQKPERASARTPRPRARTS